MPKQTVFILMTFLHDLATAVWIGGMIGLAAATLPALRGVLGAGPQTKKVAEAIQQRLSRLVYVSIAILLISGVLLSQRAAAFRGLFSFANSYAALLSVKHLLVLLMIAIALARSLWLKAATPAQEKAKMALLLVNIVLGLGVLLLSAWTAALSSGALPPA